MYTENERRLAYALDYLKQSGIAFIQQNNWEPAVLRKSNALDIRLLPFIVNKLIPSNLKYTNGN